MENKQTPIDWLMEQITYDDGGGRRLASWIETVDLKPYFDQAQQMYYSDIQDTFNEGWCRTQEMVIKIANEQMNEPTELKPIHKFNNENKATLCNECGRIIWLGHLDELYCEECLIAKINK
jgi:hypothetical protein